MGYGETYMSTYTPVVQTKKIPVGLQVVLLALALGLSAYISIELPFMPVPWVIQNQLAILIGYRFGARVGFMSAALMLVAGFLGAPVFASGKAGPAVLLGPTGGYLMAYPFAAYLSGYLKSRMKLSSYSLLANLLLSHALIYFLGVSHLSQLIGVKPAIVYGCLPFVALDFIKSLLAARFLKN